MFIKQSKLCLQDGGLLFLQTRKPWPGTRRCLRVPISKGAVSLTQALRLQTHVPRLCLKRCCEVGVRGAGSAGPSGPLPGVNGPGVSTEPALTQAGGTAVQVASGTRPQQHCHPLPSGVPWSPAAVSICPIKMEHSERPQGRRQSWSPIET